MPVCAKRHILLKNSCHLAGREGGRERELSRNVKSVFSLVAEAVRPHTNYLKS